ncbi:hypothetical protein [Brevundimonas sp.]|jgi:hypothetical protein|uniref:hypothetical protein n=1 Tax=Brevundimonas sp. TaxID=1871086 RepID=UPI002EDA0206
MTDTAPTLKIDPSVAERTTFEKEAVWLPLFAMSNIQAGKTLIDGKTFTDCLIEGPAVLFATDNVHFEGCNLGITDNGKNLLLQTVGEKVTGVVPFANTRFVRCRFVGIGFTGHPDFLSQIADNLKITSEDA